MAIQTYINPVTKEEICFEMASTIIQLPDDCNKEWFLRYNSGELSKLIVSGGEIFTTCYEGFHLDVDTRRVKSEEEIDIDFARFLPPFICISVLFGVSNKFSNISIGPHMNTNYNLHFSMQLAEMINNNPYLNKVLLDEEFPLSLNITETYLLHLSPDQHLVSEKQLTNAIETIAFYESKGKEFWPVSICIEPLPSYQIEDTMTCRDTWTNTLRRAWFEAEYLVSKFCPDAAIGVRASKLVNYCIWLYQWTESMGIGSIEEDDLNGGPIIALKNIVSEWRAWSKIHDFDLKRSTNKDYIPDWNLECVKDLRYTLDNPIFDVLIPSFKTRRINVEQQSALNAVVGQYNLAYNPLTTVGVELSNIILEQAVNPPSAAWCINTTMNHQRDGFRSIEKCGQILVRNLKTDIVKPSICNKGNCILTEGLSLKDIYLRQKEINDCIGTERNFGGNGKLECKPINDLWNLANRYLYIIDRYFKKECLQYFLSIPSYINVRLLISDDDKQGKERRENLKRELQNKKIQNLEVKVVTCTTGPSSHPLHDRYVFSSDWGVSLSSSLIAIKSNALWAFKLEEYKQLQQRYFDFFWDNISGASKNYGPRSFKIRNLI